MALCSDHPLILSARWSRTLGRRASISFARGKRATELYGRHSCTIITMLSLSIVVVSCFRLEERGKQFEWYWRVFSSDDFGKAWSTWRGIFRKLAPLKVLMEARDVDARYVIPLNRIGKRALRDACDSIDPSGTLEQRNFSFLCFVGGVCLFIYGIFWYLRGDTATRLTITLARGRWMYCKKELIIRKIRLCIMRSQ